MGQTSFNQDTTTWASAIFAEGIGTFMLMYAILGIVDSRSPGDFAGLVIGGVVVAIIMVIGPVTGASLNPARAFGPELVSALGGGATHWNQLIPVYVLPASSGSAAAAFAYDFMTKPRCRRDADPRSRQPPRRLRPPRPDRRDPLNRATMDTATTTMKKFLNDPADVVKESLAGLAAAHGDILRYDADAQILTRAGAPVQGKVALISGGGSGHEPLHGGFVGKGMLDAACPGEVFTSPVPEQMLAATKAVDGGRRSHPHRQELHGRRDELQARSRGRRGRGDQRRVRARSTTTSPSRTRSTPRAAAASARRSCWRRSRARRGARRRPGDRRRDRAQGQRRARSFGIALSSCTPPAAGKPIFDLPEGEIEIGVGIHGEPGRRREPIRSAGELAAEIVDAVISDLKPSGRVLAFVNGLGGTPALELYLLYGEVDKLLRGQGIEPARNLVGSYITVAGDGRRFAHGARARRRARVALGRAGQHRGASLGSVRIVITATAMQSATITAWMSEINAAVQAQREHLTQLDAAIGDGDHGTNMARGFDAVVKALAGQGDTLLPGPTLVLCGKTLVATVGGASGPLWGSGAPPRRPRVERRTRDRRAPARRGAGGDGGRHQGPRRRRRRRRDDHRRPGSRSCCPA
jgi:dihydroxyacetone kinase-like protein